MGGWLGVILVNVEASADERAVEDAAQAIAARFHFEAESPPVRRVECRCGMAEAIREAEAHPEFGGAAIAKLAEGFLSLPDSAQRARFEDVRRWNNRRMAFFRDFVRTRHRPRPDCAECGGSGSRETPGPFIEYADTHWSEEDWPRVLAVEAKTRDDFVVSPDYLGAFGSIVFRDFAPPVSRPPIIGPQPLARKMLELQQQGIVLQPFSVLSPDGQWHERDELDDCCSWQERVRALLASCPDARVVPASFHG